MTDHPASQPRSRRLAFDRAPLRVYWEVTRACDLACRHCRATASPWHDPAELNLAQSLRLLEQLSSADPAPHVVFTGGDPFKRTDLFALIATARAMGLRVSVSPSATPLVTPMAIARLKEAEVDAISLSIDGSTARSHDAFRGVPGTFARTLEAARAAAAVGLPFQVNTLVAENTLDDLPAIHRLAADLGAARWSLFFLVSVGRGSVLAPVSAEACERLLCWAADLPPGKPVVTTTEAPHYRRVVAQRGRRSGAGPGHAAGIRDGNGIMFISHTGDVTPAGFLPLVAGNVADRHPFEIYRESALFRSLRNPEGFGGRCGECEFRWECGGSRARAYVQTGNPLAEDPLCQYTPASV